MKRDVIQADKIELHIGCFITSRPKGGQEALGAGSNMLVGILSTSTSKEARGTMTKHFVFNSRHTFSESLPRLGLCSKFMLTRRRQCCLSAHQQSPKTKMFSEGTRTHANVVMLVWYTVGSVTVRGGDRQAFSREITSRVRKFPKSRGSNQAGSGGNSDSYGLERVGPRGFQMSRFGSGHPDPTRPDS